MTVYFHNPGEFNFDAVRLMGVHAKITDNPIGFFGTGLKMAIACLLRCGCKIELITGGNSYHFTTRTSDFRGQELEKVYMNDEALSFTTHLARNWKPWQAYRELVSNAWDEGGDVSDTPQEADIVFRVTGTEMDNARAKHNHIFLTTLPVAETTYLAIHPGPSKNIYYRGIVVGEFQHTCAFTYNFKSSITLTEDRTIKSVWDAQWLLQRELPAIQDPKILPKLWLDPELEECKLNYSYPQYFSDEALDYIETRLTDITMPESLISAYEERRQVNVRWQKAETSTYEEKCNEKAMKKLRRININLQRSDFTVTESLGSCVYGLFDGKSGNIYIARQTLHNGVDFIAATLYEEWLHKDHHLKDCTRGMQQVLFDQIIALINQLEIMEE